jgi:hypothetical protein
VRNVEHVGRLLTKVSENEVALFLSNARGEEASLLVLPHPSIGLKESEHQNESFTIKASVTCSSPNTQQEFDLLYTIEGFHWSVSYS